MKLPRTGEDNCLLAPSRCCDDDGAKSGDSAAHPPDPRGWGLPGFPTVCSPPRQEPGGGSRGLHLQGQPPLPQPPIAGPHILAEAQVLDEGLGSFHNRRKEPNTKHDTKKTRESVQTLVWDRKRLNRPDPEPSSLVREGCSWGQIFRRACKL